ncbi:MAG: hypothetical protein JSS81_27510, partial [Acidobacteria bacterium]|nr:hypothetical protein [Acidobacteriota bacterium]
MYTPEERVGFYRKKRLSGGRRPANELCNPCSTKPEKAATAVPKSVASAVADAPSAGRALASQIVQQQGFQSSVKSHRRSSASAIADAADLARLSPLFSSITQLLFSVAADGPTPAILQRPIAVNLLSTAIDAFFTAIDAFFTAVDERFTAVDERFTAVDERFTAVEIDFTCGKSLINRG